MSAAKEIPPLTHGSGTGDAPDEVRRRLLLTATGSLGAIGLVASAIPFIASLRPSARASAAGAPVEMDVTQLQAGALIAAEWRRKPVWIVHRTERMLAALRDPSHIAKLADPDSRVASQQPEYARNPLRSLHREYLVVVPICTHLGCIPTFRPEFAPRDLGPEWQGGFYCPCHGSKFDLAGRVYRSVPAPTNLVIPDYHYLTNLTVEIGEGPKSKRE